MSLPFLDPNKNLYVNLGMAIIIIKRLSTAKRNKPILTNEKFQLFMYLVKNPVILNRVFQHNGIETILLKQEDTYSFNSISSNLDPLFDRKLIEIITTILLRKKIVQVNYKKQIKFYFKLTELGNNIANALNSSYFTEIKYISERMRVLQNYSESNLYESVYRAINREFQNE